MDQQSIFNEVKACSNNATLFALCGKLADLINSPNQEPINPDPSKFQEALNSLSIDSTDEEVKACLRITLIDKVRTGELIPSELQQFAKLFNLESSKGEVPIECVDFSSMCADCPLLEAPDPASIADPVFLMNPDTSSPGNPTLGGSQEGVQSEQENKSKPMI